MKITNKEIKITKQNKQETEKPNNPNSQKDNQSFIAQEIIAAGLLF